MSKQVILALILVIIIFVGAAGPAPAPAQGQAPPEPRGPGWHLGVADPVSPAEARRMLADRPPSASRAPAALPISET